MLTGTDLIKAHEFLREQWGEEVYANILEAVNSYTCPIMGAKKFLDNCLMCGGNWGGMLLSGIRKLYPAVWDAIPDNMGVHSFGCICSVLMLCKIDTSVDKRPEEEEEEEGE